jgi:hypothetical protein
VPKAAQGGEIAGGQYRSPRDEWCWVHESSGIGAGLQFAAAPVEDEEAFHDVSASLVREANVAKSLAHQ